MRQCGQDTRTITRVDLEPVATTVIHVAVDFLGIDQDLMAGLTTDVSHEPNATCVMFERGVVQSLLPGRDTGRGQPTVLSVGHLILCSFAMPFQTSGRS